MNGSARGREEVEGRGWGCTSPVMNALIILGSGELPFQVKRVGSHWTREPEN